MGVTLRDRAGSVRLGASVDVDKPYRSPTMGQARGTGPACDKEVR
jgi:hypothetical protein